ncbi:hypothetical protein OEM_33920 [Mycobacterium intracellulare subsp. yongonense 05-1390]|uniref:phage major capsid protein n=1 Tax=Mycobacterium TaxID=1763 RepID=UPI0003555BA0|nr:MULTISPECIES: phage major capsid protein [Mycobacterium]AGP64927.1 hypothetical protein OEM_33920 [Mycobacterium intracellulare subsp. yongonense 05-1390]ARR79002.1 putative phage capsid protein [Mycobacterium intracellulare subsp. yongonense]ARR84069.1 putative phage capsid protein [Mycobacterium intracellulare subsp. yongonense]KEF95176.1 HK97 family phage major capsid protein [Mycobacterium sp. TKK-01-0059]OCB20612.1 phage capsid protein [Mycobacterium intracellulare subsp. yongonense]
MKTIDELLVEQRAVLDAAEGRNLTDDEVEKYETLETELKATQRSEAIRARQGAYEAPNASLQAAVHVAAPKQDDTLERAFDHYLRTGIPNADITELRDGQTAGTTTAGGYMVPTTLLNKITDRLKAFGGVANAVEVITTSAGEPLTWPTLDDTSNTGVIAAEASDPGSGGADLVFGEKTIAAYKYVAPGASQLPLRVSLELLQDAAFDVQGLVTRKLSQRIARAQAAHWVNGTGSSQPYGISTGTAATAIAGATPTYAELVAIVHSVDPAYRDSAVWTFNDKTMSLIETLVDGNNRPLLNSSIDGIDVGRSNQRLLGYPVVIDQAWADSTDASSHKWGAFGDLQSGYVIRRVQDVTLIVNPYTRANEGQIEYTMWARADGVPQDTNAYRVLVNDAS